MTVLAIDIATPQGSLALARDGEVLEEFTLDGPSGYGEVIFAAVDGLLRRHAVTTAEIDVFAVACGPGTFTGVRMGITLAQGLAEAHAKGVVGISNLAALAYTGHGAMRYPALDARRGEFYTAVYRETGELLGEERLVAVAPEGALRQTGPLAGAVAALALRQRPLDPAQLEANYIRQSDAELNLIVRPLLPPRT